MAEIEYNAYDEMMARLAQSFEQALKNALAKPYPYAPGFNKSRPAKGVRNMTRKTGNLYNSINVSFDPRTNQILVNMLDYWRYVNDGREPGKYVPITPLIKWIRNKGFNKDVKTGRFKKFNIKGMAFAVSTNIKRFGIAPTYFYDVAFEEFEKEFENEAVQALEIDIANFFEKVIEL
jgi:hypothetical protein